MSRLWLLRTGTAILTVLCAALVACGGSELLSEQTFELPAAGFSLKADPQLFTIVTGEALERALSPDFLHAKAEQGLRAVMWVDLKTKSSEKGAGAFVYLADGSAMVDVDALGSLLGMDGVIQSTYEKLAKQLASSESALSTPSPMRTVVLGGAKGFSTDYELMDGTALYHRREYYLMSKTHAYWISVFAPRKLWQARQEAFVGTVESFGIINPSDRVQ